MENLLFNAAYFCYSATTLLYILYWLTKHEQFSRMAFGFLLTALVIHSGSLIDRTVVTRSHFIHDALLKQQSGDLAGALNLQQAARSYYPWSNWFETLSFFGAIVSLIFFLISLSIHIPLLGAFIMPVGWILLTLGAFSNKGLMAADPIVHSRWLMLHVPTIFAAYALLGVAFAVGIAYLLQERQMKSKRPNEMSYRLPSLERLDNLIFQLVAVAFPMLTLGLASGCVWAYHAWGRVWSWDPKETWALVTWLIYGSYLVSRLFLGWRGRKAAYLSMVGFVLILFTYVGVNYMSPLHGFLTGTGR